MRRNRSTRRLGDSQSLGSAYSVYPKTHSPSLNAFELLFVLLNPSELLESVVSGVFAAPESGSGWLGVGG